MASFWESVAHSGNRCFSLYVFVFLVIFHFGLEGGTGSDCSSSLIVLTFFTVVTYIIVLSLTQ